jgi:hypothetical protein
VNVQVVIDKHLLVVGAAWCVESVMVTTTKTTHSKVQGTCSLGAHVAFERGAIACTQQRSSDQPNLMHHQQGGTVAVRALNMDPAPWHDEADHTLHLGTWIPVLFCILRLDLNPGSAVQGLAYDPALSQMDHSS